MTERVVKKISHDTLSLESAILLIAALLLKDEQFMVIGLIDFRI